MGKINKVIKLEDLPKDGLKALEKQYPEGWKAHIRKITKPNGDYFHAINVDTKEISYLVKLDVKIDMNSDMVKMVDDFIDENAEKEAKSDSGDENEEDEGDEDQKEIIWNTKNAKSKIIIQKPFPKRRGLLFFIIHKTI